MTTEESGIFLIKELVTPCNEGVAAQIAKLVNAATAAEREECAKIAESHPNRWGGIESEVQAPIATAIRARGKV